MACYKKFFLICLFVLFLILFFSSSSKAFVFEYEGSSIDFKDPPYPNYYIEFYSSSSGYSFFVCTSVEDISKLKFNSDNTGIKFYSNWSTASYASYTRDLPFIGKSVNDYPIYGAQTSSSNYHNFNVSQIIFSTFDIKTFSGDVLYPATEVPKKLPYIANKESELQNMTSDTVLNFVTQGYQNCQIKFLNLTSNKELFFINLSDYSDYYQRIDLSDPMSDLAYCIPVSVLPNFELISNNSYDFKFFYSDEGVQNVIDFEFISLVSSNLRTGSSSRYF